MTDDQLSLKYCFTCPLPDCRPNSVRCPINQHRQAQPTPDYPPPGFLTVRQLGARLGVHEATIYRWLRRGLVDQRGFRQGRRGAALVPVGRVGEFERLLV